MKVALILAAGGATRMGSPKALVGLDGETLLERALANVRGAGLEPFVVLGHAADDHLGYLDGARYGVCADWSDGMGRSIAFGVESVREDADIIGVVAVDQPDITAHHLSVLAGSVTDGIAATRYPDGSLGVPAFFAHRLFDELAALSGDRGARDLIRSERYPTAAVDGADTSDLDTPADLASYREGHR